jgi:uncharacterized protein (TIGR03435 family)
MCIFDKRIVCKALLFVVSMPLVTAAQNQPLAFEVASVKPVASVPTGGPRGTTGVVIGAGIPQLDNHRFWTTHATLYAMVKWAYGLMNGPCAFSECDFLTGGPAWIRSDQFDVQAVMPDNSPLYTVPQFHNNQAPELHAMLQSLLADRFKLTVHRKMKVMPVYVLTVAKDGPKLVPAKAEDSKRIAMTGNPAIAASDREIIGRKASIADLVNLLQLPGLTDRPVLDRTRLSGEFNFNAKFAPVDNNALGNTSSPSIFTALQEQLGLKLEATRAPIEILVIDHAEKPTAN